MNLREQHRESSSDSSDDEDWDEFMTNEDSAGESDTEVSEDCSTSGLSSKCGSIKYTNLRPSGTRTPAHNISTVQSGLSSEARGLATQNEFFQILLDNAIMNEIVQYTNKYMTSMNSKSSPISLQELEKWIGILIYIGVVKQKDMDLSEIWEGEINYDFIRSCMSLSRFNLIKKFIRFDDKSTRTGPSRDKLEPIRIIFQVFIQNCQSVYNPSEQLTIDEQLIT